MHHNSKEAKRAAQRLFFYRGVGRYPNKDNYDFLVPTRPKAAAPAIYNAMHKPQHWQVVAIAYFKAQDGTEYREHAAVRSIQAFNAADLKYNEQGRIYPDEEGNPAIDDHLTDLLGPCVDAAESGGNPKHHTHTGLIMRVWTKRLGSIRPVLKRLQKTFDLSDQEVDEMATEFDEGNI